MHFEDLCKSARIVRQGIDFYCHRCCKTRTMSYSGKDAGLEISPFNSMNNPFFIAIGVAIKLLMYEPSDLDSRLSFVNTKNALIGHALYVLRD